MGHQAISFEPRHLATDAPPNVEVCGGPPQSNVARRFRHARTTAGLGGTQHDVVVMAASRMRQVRLWMVQGKDCESLSSQ